MKWVLSLSKGLLRAFNTRYAAFSFTSEHVVLDVLSVWSNSVSRFICDRTPGSRPAQDLKNLVLESGKQWHHLVDNNNSKSFASRFLLDTNHYEEIEPESIRPDTRERPRLTKYERNSLRILRLDYEALASKGRAVKIKSAFRKMAKVYHPDLGGDAQKFRELKEAHERMLDWAENPQYTSRKALRHCWSYDGATNRWSPPL